METTSPCGVINFGELVGKACQSFRRLVSVYGVANHTYAYRKPNPEVTFPWKFRPREYRQAKLPYAWKKTYQETGVSPMDHVLYLPRQSELAHFLYG
jgi:hypothetical protein